MAILTSDGVYEPSGLHFLIDEGLLTKDVEPSAYHWHDQLFEDDDGVTGVEEILRLESCVVWSRNGSVKQVFNLKVEGETILHAFPTYFTAPSPLGLPLADSEQDRRRVAALVVVLKTQAHIFTLTGGIHVIPLSRQFPKAFPFDGGFVLQTTSNRSNHLDNKKSFAANVGRAHEDSGQPFNLSAADGSDFCPTYSVTDLLSELSVIAANYTRRVQDIEILPILSTDDEILYMSTYGDLPSTSFPNVKIAVTRNRMTKQTTIWQVSRRSTGVAPGRGHATKPRKRQSSNIHERSRVPSGRVPPDASRQSFGLMQSFVGEENKAQGSQLSNIEHLAAELGRDLEPLGVQTRSARRISSMLARTDLVPANERSTFNESIIAGRKSMSRTLRQEGSFGSFTDRHSLGARKSFPNATSIHSTTASFIDVNSRLSLGESMMQSSVQKGHCIDDRLQRNLLFTKVKSFPTGSADARPRILILPHPPSSAVEDINQRHFSVCIVEGEDRAMTVITISTKYTDQNKSQNQTLELKAVQIQQGSSIADACVVQDSGIYRLLVLSKTSTGNDVLHLEAPWSSSFLVDPPSHHRAASFTAGDRPIKHKDSGDISSSHSDQKRVRIEQLLSSANCGSFIGVNDMSVQHRICVRMMPKQGLVRRILEVCRYVLPSHLRESMIVAYWEVDRWLNAQTSAIKHDCAAIAVTLFLLAVPFINAMQTKPMTPGRRKKGLNIRSNSGTLIETASWTAMQAYAASNNSPAWTHSASWAWSTSQRDETAENASTASRPFAQLSLGLDSKMMPISTFTDLTREFLQSPAGETMTGPEGYLPTAMNQDRITRRTSLASIVVALYLLLEELKLSALTQESLQNDCAVLAALLAQLSSWLKWTSWQEALQTYVNTRFSPSSVTFDRLVIDGLDTPSELFPPTSIFDAVDQWLSTDSNVSFRSLHELVAQSQLEHDHPLLLEERRLLPKLSVVGDIISGQTAKVASILTGGVGTLLITEVITHVCGNRALPDTKPSSPEGIVAHQGRRVRQPQAPNMQHTSMMVRDVHTMCTQALDADAISRWDASSELDRQAITKLVFRHDRRFQEASKLVNQTRKPDLEYDLVPGWTEAEALDAQKILTYYATRRTFAVVAGRGMIHYMSKTPMLTEQVPRPHFSMSCTVRPKTNSEEVTAMTLDADKTLFQEDKVSWAYFHSGAAAGLMISNEAEFIDTSWILYNKPSEHLSNRHAGFLLALGLNGHLKNLAKWVAFKYLTPKHTMTSIGLLLGMAASYYGTADSLITRLLSVHVTCLLPPGAAELNLSPLTQATGLIGVGLVYSNTQHRRMSEVMLSEVECQDPEEPTSDEPILRDEGYRLAAGMALGLINLGHGQSLRAIHDLRIAERLLAIAVGPKNVNIVQILDRATAGAIVAVAFIYMKTSNKAIAAKIDIPDTVLQYDYVRPDMFLLRTLARHLIMWDEISPTFDFVRDSLPKRYAHRASLKTSKRLITNDLPYFHVVAGICFALALKHAGSQRKDVRDLLVEFLDQFMRVARLPALNYDAKVTLNGIRNCLDITALSCAIVMAGSGDLVVYRRLRSLHGRVDKETPFGSHLATHMAIGALFLSGGTATFGTSNLAVAALVIAFYPMFPTDVLDNHGHLQALRHLWVLAVEHRCLVLRDDEDGSVLSNIEIKVSLKDGGCQKLCSPCLLPDLDLIDTIDVAADSYWPLQQKFDSTSPTVPGTQGTRTWRDVYKSSKSGITMSLRRRTLYDRIDADGFNVEFEALDKAQGVPRGAMSFASHHIHRDSVKTMDWVFNKAVFNQLDQADREILQHDYIARDQTEASGTSAVLRTTPVDTALDLYIGALGPDQINEVLRKPLRIDKLWQIRLVLSWVEQLERKNSARSAETKVETQTWLRQQVIEKLKWKIWYMESGQNDGN